MRYKHKMVLWRVQSQIWYEINYVHTTLSSSYSIPRNAPCPTYIYSRPILSLKSSVVAKQRRRRTRPKPKIANYAPLRRLLWTYPVSRLSGWLDERYTRSRDSCDFWKRLREIQSHQNKIPQDNIFWWDAKNCKNHGEWVWRYACLFGAMTANNGGGIWPLRGLLHICETAEVWLFARKFLDSLIFPVEISC